MIPKDKFPHPLAPELSEDELRARGYDVLAADGHGCGKDAVGAQLPAMLVRVDVIRIVAAGAEVLEVAERAAVGPAVVTKLRTALLI